jgi:uncharacterized membrane protein (DUF106 family)
MAPWLVVWFVVGIVSTTAILAFLIALMRHLLVLGRTMKRLQDELQPIADDVAREGQRAGAHASAIGERRRRGSAANARG